MDYGYLVAPGDEQPGDLVFVRGTAWPSLVIRLSQLAPVSHVGIVVARRDDYSIDIAEALNGGFVRTENVPAPPGYSVRIPGVDGDALAARAMAMVAEKRKYNWLAILAHAGRFFERFWLTFVAGKMLQRIISRLTRNSERVICSEAVLDLLRDEMGDDAELLAPLKDRPSFTVSPVDLMRVVLPHRAPKSG